MTLLFSLLVSEEVSNLVVLVHFWLFSIIDGRVAMLLQLIFVNKQTPRRVSSVRSKMKNEKFDLDKTNEKSNLVASMQIQNVANSLLRRHFWILSSQE